MNKLNRRDFFKQSILAAGALAVLPANFPQVVSNKIQQAFEAKKIVIAGAGLAGLVAAFELKQAGHEVIVLEARSRSGGRVLTLREPFSDQLYAEAGASRIHATHHLTLKYARDFGLELIPFYPSNGNFVTLNRTKRREVDWRKFAGEIKEIVRLDNRQDWFKIRGGNDLLPQSFAKRLTGAIIFDAPVVKIEQNDSGVQVTFLQSGQTEKLICDYFVSAIPFSTLKKIEIVPPFSPPKQQVIELLQYGSASRVFLQVQNRFWTAQNANGFAMADKTTEIWDSTFSQAGSRGILQTYLRGFESEKITALPEAERIKATLERMEKVFPGALRNFEKGVAKCWSDDEWSRGAWAHTDEKTVSIIKAIEGRIHFAGDHASQQTSWMQGALESGLRASREISEAAKSAAISSEQTRS